MFSVHLQSSLLIFCKTECIFFPYLHLQQRPGGEAPIFNLQHSISIAFFFFILICSEALLNCNLTISLSEEIKYSYVKKYSLTSRPEIECTDMGTGFLLLFVFCGRSSYWLHEELFPFSHRRILHPRAVKLYLILHCVLTWRNHLSCKIEHVLHQMMLHTSSWNSIKWPVISDPWSWWHPRILVLPIHTQVL